MKSDILGPRRDKHGRLVCWCTGYWFPHRKGGGACDHSKSRDIHLARRRGDAEMLLQAVVNFGWDFARLHTRGPCPF